MSGLAGKRVRAAAPGLGEATGVATGVHAPGAPANRARSRASALPRNRLAARPPAVGRGPSVRAARRASARRCARGSGARGRAGLRLFGRHSTVDSELARTGGIRLSN